jgi:Glycosyl transferase family 2
MKIEVHSLLHNEAPLVPYFVQHYCQFADIYFYESDSTDGSPQIAKILGAHVIPFETGNEINELTFLKMKNNCWKKSKADWVIIVDTDEFVYHHDIVNILKNTKYTAFHPKEYRMIADTFPTCHGQIYDEVKYGVPGLPGYNKINIFRPDQITDMNYDAGCHSCSPQGNVHVCEETDIITMHFRDLGIKYRIARNAYIDSRRTQINKERGWGTHVTWSEEKIRADLSEAKKHLVQVI